MLSRIDQVTKSFYSLPIDEVLPDDILAYILSFVPCTARTTNKHMNKIGIKREKIAMQNLYKPYRQTQKQTWIVHRKRPYLNEIEKQLGYKGPVARIETAVNLCESGARLLIHNGTYHADMVEIRDKTVEFIGIGNNVRINVQNPQCDASMFNIYGGSVDIENITFDASNYYNIIDIDVSLSIIAIVNIKKCKFCVDRYGITVRNACKVNIEDCKFFGGDFGIYIWDDEPSSVTVKHSKFTDFAVSAVYIRQDGISDKFNNVRCECNRWVNVSNPIGVYVEELEERPTEFEELKNGLGLSSYIIKDNEYVWAGQSDANILYANKIHIFKEYPE